MKNLRLILLFLTTGFLGCSQELPVRTSSGEKVIMAQNVSLYRKKPHIWPAKGKLIATKDELLFIPTPYYWIANIHGRDTTIIKLDSIERLESNRWVLIFPFRLEVETEHKTYPFITVRREKLAKEIQRLKE